MIARGCNGLFVSDTQKCVSSLVRAGLGEIYNSNKFNHVNEVVSQMQYFSPNVYNLLHHVTLKFWVKKAIPGVI